MAVAAVDTAAVVATVTDPEDIQDHETTGDQGNASRYL
jgi:hypothetical protein